MTRRSPQRNAGHDPDKTVIFLGAGASAAEGAPVQADLFREYFKSYRRRPEGAMYEEMDRELATYFERFWGIDVDHGDLDRAQFPTFEEALGLLEMAESRAEFFKDFTGLYPERTRGREMRSHIVNLIGRILHEKLETWRGHHTVLVSSVKDAGQLPSTTFIGLNYDILIDKAVFSETGSDPDFGVTVEPEDRQAYGPAQGGGQHVKLLKLHGSLNWLLCPTCNVLFFDRYEKSAVRSSEQAHRIPCPTCQEPRVPLIVPPTFFKVMSNYFLQCIWKAAEDKLKEANRIIFCGYSFPDADIHVRYLLKRAEMNRPEVGTPPDVFIVNQKSGKRRSERKREYARYKRFFRHKAEVHWTNLSFEQFAENPQTIEEYIDGRE